MSSVTRLHLLSQSMLNVSCQKQNHCSFPLTLTDSFMEYAGQTRLSEACNLLAVPGLSSLDVDDDEGEVVIGIRPKSSPLPRRKSSVSDEDSEPEPPPCGSRRVSFADAKGLRLVQVKEFDTWDIPKLPGYDAPEGKGIDAEEYVLSPFTFSLPLSSEELLAKVQEQKVELETIELLPGTTILKGMIRVLNISYSKAVYIRTTLDKWSTHFDLLAEYIPGSSDGVMDCFSFKLTLVPPFGEQGVRVDFCLRYETPVGTFWSNNNNRNYVLFCHHRMKEEKEQPHKENVNKKSCLKTVSQNVSAVENSSSERAQYASTDVSNKGEEVDSTKAKKASDGLSRKSDDQRQKLLVENRQNSSRRRQRKATRMARVRDHFTQRDGGANDSDRDESPPEIKQATLEGISGGKHADVQSFSGGNSKAECTEFVCEALHSVAHEPKEREKSDPATLARVESVTDIPKHPLSSADASAQGDQQNITENQSMSCASANNTAGESSDSLVSQACNFTFGTVVALLYHQVFGRVRSEGLNAGDEENPVDPGNINPLSERKLTESIDPTVTNRNSSRVKENMTDDWESDHESLNATPSSPPSEEVANILSSTETLQNPANIIKKPDQSSTNPSQGPQTSLGDALERCDTVNVLLGTNLLNPQIFSEGVHFQGGSQEEKPTHDLPGQSWAKPPQQTCAQMVTRVDETLGGSETQDAFSVSQSVSGPVNEEADQQTSMTGENSCGCAEVNHNHDTGKTVTTSKSSPSLNEEKQLERLKDSNSGDIDDTFTTSSAISLVSGEPERKDLMTLETSSETQEETSNKKEEYDGTLVPHEDEIEHSGDIKLTHKAADSVTNEGMSNHSQADVLEQLKEEITVKKTEHCETEAAASKEDEDLYSADINEVKNWEMMVEEEENNILAHEEEMKLINAKAADTESVETDSSERKKIGEFAEEMLVGGEKEDMMDNIVGLGDEEMKREAEIVEIVAVKDAELEYVQVTSTDEIVGVEEMSEIDKTEGPEETEMHKEKHFAEIQRVSIVQDEEGIEVEKKMEIDLNYKGEAGVEQEDQIELNQENKEEQNSDYKEEIIVDEAAEAETADADSYMEIEDRDDEGGYSEERSDIAQNRVADGLSALVSNMLDVDKEDTSEGRHPHNEPGFQSDADVSHDRPKADKQHPALEGDVCVSACELDSDPTSHDSASAESDSDDEVELYMHCLRAVGAPAQAHKDRIKGAGVAVSRRPSISRGKLSSTPMPSISESLDEEQHFGSSENQDDVRTAAAEAPSESSGQGGSGQKVSWWTGTFSCSNILKTLLYTSLMVIFLVVAYHYDFLACLGLYLISLIWLCCQGEKQSVKNNSKAD
ncbi:uncharacterized protein ppp1r3ab [Odontesthes bonariensis]|uniref:uncharacterized protein ppp1r3ab n=1 Tax=Odontesthes bonariensis TaxID=219752 RepID=UPI003F58B1D6